MLLTALAFVKAQHALQLEIETNLKMEATSMAAAIDKMMFERLQNAAIWARLDVMQDMQLHDVDKRASQFLTDLQLGYRGVYQSLSCIDPLGNVICSSNPERIGQRLARNDEWQQAQLSGTKVTLELPTAENPPVLVMRVPVPATFSAGTLGDLRLDLDWSAIYAMLDQASDNGKRMLAVIDRSGRIIAASKNLRDRNLSLNRTLSSWRTESEHATINRQSGQPLLNADVIIGAARSQGFSSFSGFGWTTLVIQPVSQALAPVHHMAWIFFGLLALSTSVVVIIATWISHEIARPIVSLTGFAREYIRSRVLRAPPAAGQSEVGELTTAFVQMVRDIDQSQQKLIRASKLAVVGEMSAVIAHEVRTPLGILRSSAQMLKRENEISPEGRELLGFIDSETERLNRLVSAMLDAATPRAPLFSTLNMHDLIDRCVAMLGAQAKNRGIEVFSTLRAENAVIECDEKQMTQVLLNVLMNGLQILAQGGRIELSTHDDANNLYIDIADDGPGVDPSERKKIFEAFFFKREGGIGLGLAIVQQIIHAHNGEIEVGESTMGGAVFQIRLPRNPMV